MFVFFIACLISAYAKSTLSISAVVFSVMSQRSFCMLFLKGAF